MSFMTASVREHAPQFFIDMGQVIFNRARRNAKLVGNLLVAFSFQQQLRYLQVFLSELAFFGGGNHFSWVPSCYQDTIPQAAKQAAKFCPIPCLRSQARGVNQLLVKKGGFLRG